MTRWLLRRPADRDSVMRPITGARRARWSARRSAWLLPGGALVWRTLPLGGRLLVAVDALDPDGTDPIAAPRQVLRSEPQIRHRGLRPGNGHLSQLVSQQPADGLHVLRLDADVEQLPELLD